MTTLSLKTASDEAINAAVAEYCAGLTIVPPNIGHNQPMCFREPRTAANQLPTAIPNYLHDANAVIELLQKAENVEIKLTRMPGWQVWVSRGHMDHDHEEDNFCKAAAIALLKASGKIEVIE